MIGVTLETDNETSTGLQSPLPGGITTELSTLTPFYLEWYFSLPIVLVTFAVVAIVLSCLFCWRKPYKTAVVRLSEPLPDAVLGSVLAPEGIIQPDVTFYTQVVSYQKVPTPGEERRSNTPRLTTPLRPLDPAYQPTQPVTITTVRVPSFSTDLTLPPGYVSLRDTK